MIEIEEQEKLLLAISKALKKKVVAYAIGGTAMMFYGFKDATKDIDLVFESEEERDIFKESAIAVGFERMDAITVYNNKKNHPEMVRAGDVRIDLFANDIILFRFSGAMKQRAKKAYQFGDNLLLKAADLHDIILLKCATDRVRDIEDAFTIIKNMKVDWNIIVEGAENQVRLGNGIALLDLGDFFERINKKESNLVPARVLDKIYTLLLKQIKTKKKAVNH